MIERWPSMSIDWLERIQTQDPDQFHFFLSLHQAIVEREAHNAKQRELEHKKKLRRGRK